jgi:hypothetical protein
VATGVVQHQKVLGLVWLQPRLLASQPTLCNWQAFITFQAVQSDQVRFEFSHHRQHIDSSRPNGRLAWIESLRQSLTFLSELVEGSSGSTSDRANRSSLITIKVSPAR